MFNRDNAYKPSRGDLRFRDAKIGNTAKSNPFETARLLRGVSHDYLSVLAASNSGDTSKPFRVQIDAELSRRTAQRATRIAIGSLAVAIASLLISAAGFVHTIEQGAQPHRSVGLLK